MMYVAKNMRTSPRLRPQTGFTLIELTIATGILMIISTAALPVIRFTILREREYQLHKDLREMRLAIDRYKDDADRNLLRTEVGSEGYPPDLDTLVKGVNTGTSGTDKKRYLRRIPVDPITGTKDWGLRSIQDDVDSTSWGGGNVFDVYSKSQAIALDGTKYSDW
jgi:general secretion pathway protein G